MAYTELAECLNCGYRVPLRRAGHIKKCPSRGLSSANQLSEEQKKRLYDNQVTLLAREKDS